MKPKVILSKYLDKVFETPSKEGSEWFGYYNYDTLNHDKTKMLCNRALFDGVAPKKGMQIELGYYDVTSGEWHHITYTDSWNWQQGAMMQWLPGEGNENKVVYNCTRDNHNTACIYDIASQETKEIDWAIYGITPDGKRSIALEMERSHWCRAYHYKSVSNKYWEGRVVGEDGIFEVDLYNNTRKRIIAIQDIINADYKPEFDIAKHWLEHIMICPDGSKFCFLHRYSPENNVFAYKTRVCIANIDGTKLQVIDGTDKYEWSHFGWSHQNSFCIYAYKNERFIGVPGLSELIRGKNISISNIFKRFVLTISRFLPRRLRILVSGRDSYYQLYKSDDKSQYVLSEEWRKSLFDLDGHPSFSTNDNYIITDTYPNREGFQHLIVYNLKTRKGIIIAEFYANYHGNPASCDLHPKLSTDNKYIVVDTAFNEKHHMMMFELKWDLIKSKIA